MFATYVLLYNDSLIFWVLPILSRGENNTAFSQNSHLDFLDRQ